MAHPTYEEVLHLAQELPTDERDRLLNALTVQAESVSDSIQRLRQRITHPVKTTPEERAAIRATLDRVRTEVGNAWSSEMSAVEAVQEQRREL